MRSSKFMIIKSHKAVYFGELDDEQCKHGKGITIS
jgi:hypothetical protein